MRFVLYHRIGHADSAAVRRRIVALDLKSRVDFQNVDDDGAAAFAARGGRRVPALWDGTSLHQGRDAALSVIEAMRR
ncbi:MAG TPA: hypothetical protein VJP45_06895 [Candidatus Limnocylindria bacterium]|nr:hypothetical protein [Candidatus Limnocylindria bacterium]